MLVQKTTAITETCVLLLYEANYSSQWLKCNGTQGNAVPPPPVYDSKRSPPQIVVHSPYRPTSASCYNESTVNSVRLICSKTTCVCLCSVLLNSLRSRTFSTTVRDKNKKLITRWDSERELSLRRHCTRIKNTIDTCINSATYRFLQRRFTKFSEITQCNGHYAVQGHSRSPILVPIESSYMTSY